MSWGVPVGFVCWRRSRFWGTFTRTACFHVDSTPPVRVAAESRIYLMSLVLVLCLPTTQALIATRLFKHSRIYVSRCTISLLVADDVPMTYAEYMTWRKKREEADGLQPIAASMTSAAPANRIGIPVGQLAEVSSCEDWARLRGHGPMSRAMQPLVVPRHVSSRGTGMGAEAAEANESDRMQLLQKIRDAGVAGIISYGVVQVAFWGASIPFCILAYYKVTGHWPDLSNAEDQAQLGAEAFAFLNLARLAIPLRIALALYLTQGVQTNVVDKFRAS